MTEETPRVDVERLRAQSRKLLALNPNYFGTAPDWPMKPKYEMSKVSTYEGLGCVAYNQAHDLLTATVELRRASGYNGGLCGAGSREYVRFYVDYGSGWQDAGAGSTVVHDPGNATDCGGDATLPLTYAVSVVYTGDRASCFKPRLPRVRAILSWNAEPPAGQPDWTPVWGDVHECAIQLRPRRLRFPDLIGPLKVDLSDIVAMVPSLLADTPLTLSSKVTPVVAPSAADVKHRYVDPPDVTVEPHRFALPALQQAVLSKSVVAEWADIGVALPELADALVDLSGDTSYEEVDCLALDNNRGALTATFAVKRPYGYNGTLCKPGSQEHVAFWADWDDTCEWTYLGTVAVTVHDFPELPDGGLCYAAMLPVDLAAVRKPCHESGPSRVRAVLSWNSPPSTTDPDDVPHWGNVLDAHVQVAPGQPVDPNNPVPLIAILGGVETAQIDPATGLTTPTAVLAENGQPIDGDGRPCPFAGIVTVRGYSYPGHTYRVLVRAPGGGWAPVMTPFRTIDGTGVGTWRTPGADGWTPYLDFFQNVTSTLGAWHTTGDERWEVRLEIQGVAGSDTRTVQLHNTFVDDTTFSLEITTGACRQYIPGEPIGGTFTVSHPYLRGWGFSLLSSAPQPASFSPASGSTPMVNESWSLTTDLAIQPCGYVVHLGMSDRAVVNSHSLGRHSARHEGLCIVAPEE
ncbi:MAG TPA: hypothetical protein VNA20_01255 [Frankiaceae bacterium]|nr:hypothetical protein [Frankiaceae bacterium]